MGLLFPLGTSEISPHPRAPCPWKPSSFLGRWARAEEARLIVKGEEVRIVGMMAIVGWKITWSGQAKARVEEEEAWIVTSPTRPSLVGPQLGRTCWSEVFS